MTYLSFIQDATELFSNGFLTTFSPQLGVEYSRGKTAHLLIGDEIEFWKQEARRITVAPHVEHTDTVFIGISSAGEDGAFTHDIMDLRGADGKHIVTSYLLKFVCATCEETGVEEVILGCRHMTMWIPRHKDLRNYVRQALINALWEGQREQQMMEAYGLIHSARAGQLAPYLPDLYCGKKVRLQDIRDKARAVMVCVDPNFSGVDRGSEFAVTSMVHFANGVHVVSGGIPTVR